jgi:thiol-disulfide isomerase/thioredoxin
MKFLKSTGLMLGFGLLVYLGFKIYQAPRFNDGEVAPGFQAELINGESFSLSDLNGKYVLLDFWGSWCGPCRQESPDLVKLYETFFSKTFIDAEGFEIVSIAIETNETRWKKAIASDNLNWPHHIVQLDRFAGPIAREYGVREIPTKYLLNTRGEILMVNPPFEELDKFLKGKLK